MNVALAANTIASERRRLAKLLPKSAWFPDFGGTYLLPAPAAAPFTAAITGCAWCASSRPFACPRAARAPVPCRSFSRPLPSSARSPPAQKRGSPGDHHHTNVGVRRDTAKRFIHRYAKLVYERVHPVGAVHHQGGDAVMLGLEQDGRRWSSLGRIGS